MHNYYPIQRNTVPYISVYIICNVQTIACVSVRIFEQIKKKKKTHLDVDSKQVKIIIKQIHKLLFILK